MFRAQSENDSINPPESKLESLPPPLERAAFQLGLTDGESIDRIEQLLYEWCLLNLQKRGLKQISAKPPVELPLEIIAIVLDYLPQHRVYPFLSLSKGIDYIAKRRLFRKVYVFIEYPGPFLHDANDDLLHWSYLTKFQFFKLMRLGFKWPGEIVFIQENSWKTLVFEAIKKHLQPAEVTIVKKYKENVVIPSTIQVLEQSLRTSFTTHPHLAKLSLVGRRFMEPTPVKLKVDALSIFGIVGGIRGCIDLSSVKQLSLVDAYNTDEGNIYSIANQMESLKDLYVAQSNLSSDIFNKFLPYIRRLALYDPALVQIRTNFYGLTENFGLSEKWLRSTFDCAKHFRMSLQYFELANGPQTQNWPRPLRKSANVNYTHLDKYFENGEFPRLKVCVVESGVYIIDRILGEYNSAELSNHNR
ncbi:hypothetical protein DIURU_004347 [Diutina rugosa]|uniref:F-box domain-containing protein n=1 Tax=Diutina rugosa TaxID=5481 RepID=A0A642UHT8_DIURU|nr:uncharacterized protein DIURU_004347 [Diutina rugosa]KAA8899325.1 hypothetical protein DIURU_004347 [Diutina rugosa]